MNPSKLFQQHFATALRNLRDPINHTGLHSSALLRSLSLSRVPKFSQPLPQRSLLWATHNTPSPRQTLQSSSVLQFLSNRILNATHKSKVSRRRGPLQPRGPQGPWDRIRERIEAIPSKAIFWGILALNGVVYISWQFAWSKYQSTGDSSTYIWLRQNFTVSMANVSAGRIWTPLTACISHEGTAHVFVNAFTYYFMAPPVLAILGNTGFLALYLGGGLISSLTSLFWHNNVRHNANYASHGASGAIYAVVSFFACVAPTTQFLLFGIVPIPAWAFVTGVFLFDSYSALNDRRAGTDTAGHVGGILAGIGYFLRKRFGIF